VSLDPELEAGRGSCWTAKGEKRGRKTVWEPQRHKDIRYDSRQGVGVNGKSNRSNRISLNLKSADSSLCLDKALRPEGEEKKKKKNYARER